jgi:hypothetical protein
MANSTFEVEPAAPVATSSAELAVRVRYREPASTAGFVDAAWWPRSRDLEQEIGPLLKELWADGRDVDRVSFNTGYWNDAQRRIEVDGHRVRLGSFSRQNASMIELTDAWRTQHIDVLVIDPATADDVAGRIFDRVAEGDNNDRPEEILRKAS